MRPRLQLKTRTAPVPVPVPTKPPKEEEKKEVAVVEEETTKEEVVVETKEVTQEDATPATDEAPVARTISPEPVKEDGWETVEGVKAKSSKDKDASALGKQATSGDKKDSKESGEKRASKKREPEIVNSRAAMLESAPVVKRDSTNANNRKDIGRSRGPPPVVNKRFEQLADEERGKQQEREARRGPPPIAESRFAAVAVADEDMRRRDDFKSDGPPAVANSRFSAAAEADSSYNSNRNNDDFDNRDRGPPPVVNSRFAAAAAADADRDRSFNQNRNDDRANRGPPPVANSRFAAAAEADRDRSYNRDRDNNYDRMDDRDRGPPPVANSRFAAAAEADRDYSRDRDRDEYDGGRGDRGPPPQTSSRFAAAAEADRDRSYNRDDGYGRMDSRDRGPPPVANSRFAAAAEADRDYNRDRDDYDGGRGGNRHGRDYYDDDQRGYDGPRGDRYNDAPRYHEPEPQKSSVADLLKPKARPMEENILKVPTKDQSANFLAPPSKKEQDDNVLKPRTKPAPVVESKPEKKVAAPAPVVDDAAILAEFASGNKQGDELKIWLESQAILPSVEKLVFHLLTETQPSSPDVECGWGEPDKYGKALLSLVEDDLLKQMGILFAVQKYCDKIGFPKLDDEYVVQSMFRAMYKYDFADEETFAMWKEDESPEHESGKLKAVIQTVDWFNWLEEDDDDDEDDYEDEEE